jgi:hypothetical protein
MDRSVSWTDAESVASLLARASGPRRTGRGGARYAAAAVAKPARAAAPSPAAPARSAPSLKPPPAIAVRAEPPRLVHDSDNPSDRLDALLAWTLDHQLCSGAFIADDNGLTLAAHGISEAHVSLVGPLLGTLMGIRSIPGIDATAGALWLGSNMMSWVEARAGRGAFCLGVLGPEALSASTLNILKDALEDTVRGL